MLFLSNLFCIVRVSVPCPLHPRLLHGAIRWYDMISWLWKQKKTSWDGGGGFKTKAVPRTDHETKAVWRIGYTYILILWTYYMFGTFLVSKDSPMSTDNPKIDVFCRICVGLIPSAVWGRFAVGARGLAMAVSVGKNTITGQFGRCDYPPWN